MISQDAYDETITLVKDLGTMLKELVAKFDFDEMLDAF